MYGLEFEMKLVRWAEDIYEKLGMDFNENDREAFIGDIYETIIFGLEEGEKITIEYIKSQLIG